MWDAFAKRGIIKMKINNLYCNPKHIAITTSEDCPLYYIGENMSVMFNNDDIIVKTLRQGGSHIAFGGHGGKYFRLGLECGETYTASLKVHIDSILRGNLLPDALRLRFGYIDQIWQKKYVTSEAAPNEIGIWEVHLTFTVPFEAKGVWLLFICGTQEPVDIVKISDIRITKTNGRIAPFNKINNNIKTPYRDIIDEDTCSREYIDRIEMKISDYIDYLQYAVEHDYNFDLEIVRNTAQSDIIYRSVTGLFADSVICEYSTLKAVLDACDDETKGKIAEKLILLKKYDLVEKLFQEKFLPENDFLIKLCQVNLLTEKKNNNVNKIVKKLLDDKGSLQMYSYNFSGEELFGILMPISQNTVIQRYNTTKWIINNLPEIQRRARLLCESETVQAEKSPVWVYWAQGIDNAPEIVKICVAKMRKIFGQRLHLLTDDNIHYFISAYYIEKIPTLAHKSDYIRTELLYRYGGTWIDSTVIVKDGFKDIIDRNDFVFAGWKSESNVAVSNWMMSVREKKSWLYSMMYSALMMYISTLGAFNEYFMYHCFFRILITVDQVAKEMWNNAYKISARDSIVFTKQKDELLKVLDDNEFERVYNNADLLKLTYKYDEKQMKLNSNISRIIRRNL